MDDFPDFEDSPEIFAADAAPVTFAFDRSSRSVDVDGHLRVLDCNISKANVCPYYGREIPDSAALGLDPSEVYNLYRDAAELEASASSYEGKPLMFQHVAVSADDPQKHHIVGAVSNVRYSHPYLVADLNVWDGAAIRAIESGQLEQLSCGYRYRADMTPGTIDNATYDGRMLNIFANHVALVEQGRAGSDVVVRDELPKDFLTMKRSEVISALAPFMAKDADLIAVDAALVKLAADKKAKDEAEVEEKKAADKKAKDEAEEKKKAEDEDKDDQTGEDGEMDDMDGEDEAPESPESGAKKPGGKDSKKGMDAAIKLAVDRALSDERALAAARIEVVTIVGDTAFATAGETYKAALTKLGVTVDGVDASAFPAMLKLATKANPAPVALDAAAVKPMHEAIPHYNRLSR